MSKCLKVFSLVTAIVAVNSGIIGCAFSKNKNKDEGKQAEILLETDQLRDEEFKVEIVETEELNKYFVKFSWPAGRGIRVEVQEDDLIVDSKGESSIAVPVGGGEKHKFNIEAYNSIGGSILRKVIPQDIPEDLEIADTWSLEKNYEHPKYNRIQINGDSRIATNGYDLIMYADRVYIEAGAMLETRSATKYAPSAEMLRGSRVEIHARQAHGMLRMIMSGYMGRNGRSGDQIDKDNGFTDPYLPELKGGNGRNGQNKPNTNKESEGYHCSVSPTDGGQGKQGAPGTDGEDGQAGGSTGSLNIQLQDGKNSNLMVEVVAKPGLPGKGGAGGVGRRGGAGGDPGVPVEGCPNAHRGQDGPRGQGGKSGRDGAIGKVGAMTASPGVTLKIQD